MAKERDKKIGKDQILLEASRLGQYKQIESILSQFHALKSKKKTNPLASLRKSVGPNSIRDPVTGFTCLHHAALNGHSECVKLMLDYGAKPNALDYKGSSALHLAAWAGNLEVVKTLLDHSATIASSLSSSKSTTVTTLQDYSAANYQVDSANNPKFKLIDVNLCNNDNQTPISLAAQFGHQEVVCELLEHGANVNIRNNQLESPLDLACLNGRLETVDLLLKRSINLRQDLRRPQSIISIDDEVLSSESRSLSIGGELRIRDKQENNKQPLADISNNAQANAHVRRPSGSWASLLLGRRQDSSTSSPLQQLSPNHQSPLHRLTVAGLSLRQKSSTSQEQELEAAKYLNSTEKRRATLTSGVTLQQKQLQSYKQMSVDGWFGDNQDRTINNLPEHKPFLDNQDEQQQQPLKPREKLLDHSPLHYATRRGHLSVANLLLYTYEANLLQVSSLGSVLHEIAMNNGKHSDMISLFYIYISNKQPEKRIEFLEQFLNLKNSQNKNIFQILNEINNRSAHEIKRLIYEYNEQLQRQPIQPSLLSSGGDKQQSVVDSSIVLDGNKTQHDTVYSLNHVANTQHYPDIINTQQQQKQKQQGDTSSSQQQFGDIQQINSFVTMKRVPKNQRMKEPILEESANKHLYEQQLQRNYQYAGCTQTIDRRRPTNSYNQISHQQRSFNLQSSQKPSVDAQQHGCFKQMAANPQQNYFQNEAPLPLMTRSVSNLNRGPIHHFDCESTGDNIGSDGGCVKNESLSSGLMWRQWLSRGMSTPSANQKSGAKAVKAKSGRSKSRDFGSLFSNAQQQQVKDQIVMQDHHYDNNSGHMNENKLLNNRPQSKAVDETICAKSNHLVRSQTDCSHLMGRFFGEPGYSMAAKPAMLLNHSQQQGQGHQKQQNHDLTQQAVDRRMINRHYHVYEHEFYPPRLINNNLQDGKHSINFINHQPTQTTLNRCNQNNMRAIIRGNLSNGCVIQDQNMNESLSSPGKTDQRNLVLRNNSRLSLNIDAQTRDLELDENRQLLTQQAQQYHPIDRFVSRLSKKGMSGSGVLANQMQTADLVSEQKRQELIELQRILMAGQQQQQLQQQQQFYNSHSLESHLSEPYLFESTRRALMQDFDQMIGNELLNKNHMQIIESNSHKQRPEAMLGPKQSILTGVSLDMDRYGEHLTVSGTRITMPEKHVVQDKKQESMSGDIGSCSPSEAVQVQPRKQGVSPSSSIDGGSVSLGTQTSPVDLMTGPKRAQPPPKPARPSLAGKQNEHERDVRSKTGGVIYDLPTTAESTKKPLGSSLNITAVSSQQLTSGRTALTEPPRVPPPPPPPPPTAASVMAHKVAAAAGIRISSPPIDKSGDGLTQSLSVVAPSNDQSTTVSQSSNNSHSSSMDSSGNVHLASEQFGLLKMASVTTKSLSNSSSSGSESKTVNISSRSQKTSQAIVSNSKDPDSGVCTSNSPASMSHDSESLPSGDIREAAGGGDELVSQVVAKTKKLRQNAENNTKSSAVVRHLIRRSTPNNQLLLETNEQLDTNCLSVTSPPSPKTAQMCIEEALMPLTKTSEQPKMATVTTMTSPLTAEATAQAIDRWLTVVKQNDEIECRGESDYENCQAMQQQIGIAAQNCNLFANDILTNTVNKAVCDSYASSEDSNEAGGEEDDDDYADSGSLDEISSSSSSLNTNIEQKQRENYHAESDLDCSIEPREENQRKEITLKVVIDENETDKSGEEVFYINPLELKKISTKPRSQMNDAQTLTEEELCATIDKSSGYIRFTLRKRRNQTREEGGESMAASIPALNGSSVPQKIRDTKRADALCAAAKKTKLHLSHDRESPVENVAGFLGFRRHSEISSNCISNVQNKLNNISKSMLTNPQSFSSCQNDILMTSSVSELKTSDLNNNSSIANLKLIDKQAASDLKQWFSINLAGLIEYSQKFVQNGFDNLQFLNHPTLMNDQLLKLIGIQNQSHRILILDRVYKELKEVDFDHLLMSSSDNKEKNHHQKLTTSQLLNELQLSHLVSTLDVDRMFNLSTSESVNLLKEKCCSSLPIGYRIRILSTIDFLLKKSLIPTNEKKRQEEQQPITEQASVESNSSEVDMDVSQTSSIATTSSSSSKDSIKSIVQMKQQQQELYGIGEIDQDRSIDQSVIGTKSDDSSGAKTNTGKQQQKDSPMKVEIIEDSKKVDDVTTTIYGQKKIDEDKPVVAVVGLVKQGRTGSLVSEAARKLEAVAAQKGSGVFPIPVAAARRINSSSNNFQPKSQQPTLIGSNNNVSKEKNKSSLTEKQHQLVAKEDDDKKCQQTTVLSLNKTPFVPVKSINWPPKKQAKDSPPQSHQRCTKDHLNSIKISQDINKENNIGQEQQEQAVKSRPKPALPAKPAKLAANRYIFDNSYKS